MMNVNYAQLLKNTVVPSNLPVDEKSKRYEPVVNYINSRMPAKWFRYRACNDNNLEAFYKDRIFLSCGKNMNDIFDARVCFDRDKIQKDIFSFFESKDKLLTLLPVLQAYGFDQDKLEATATMVKEYLEKLFDETLDQIHEIVREALRFACFSEVGDSAMMWGHYADCATGFVLAYDFRGENLSPCLRCDMYNNGCASPQVPSLYPVLYDDDRYDITEFAGFLFKYKALSRAFSVNNLIAPKETLDLVLPCPDQFAGTKVALHKSLEWQGEKEWRMFCPSAREINAINGISYITNKPIAVYLGMNMREIHKKIITDIAKEKGIEVYGTRIREDSGKYELVGER